jgi:hypothetical protein
MKVSEGEGGGAGSASGGRPGLQLRREVLVPVPAYRQATSLIGLSLVLVLLASAVDAVVWTYRAQRRFWREEAAESLREALSRRRAAERAVEPDRLADPMAPAREVPTISMPAISVDPAEQMVVPPPDRVGHQLD